MIKFVVLAAYILMIVVNALANILPIAGVTTGEVSNSYPNLFAPAAITFAIWGVIYLLLAGYVLYQLGLFQEKKVKKREELFEKIAPFFIISSIANSLWILAWHYNVILLSVFFMLVILYCLIKIAGILKGKTFDLKEKLFIYIPFSIYFGWITVATIANVTTFLVSIRWYGFGISPEIWTVILLIVGAIVGIAGVLRDRNIFYGMVFVWAYIGIFIKHILPSEFDSKYTLIIATAPITIVLLIIAKVYVFLRNKKLS